MIPLRLLPYHHHLINSISPLPPQLPIPQRVPFRFFGVWFSLSNNASFVKKQCHMEYQLFANKLNRKMLTVRQLTYLHNAVLLPKVEYRMMCTILSEAVCNTIAASMRRIIKHTGKFSNTLPSSFLHLDQGLHMTDLYSRHMGRFGFTHRFISHM